MENLSVFVTVASEVVASLVSRYEKVHLHAKWRIVVIFSIFFWAFVNKLWLKKSKKENTKLDTFVAGYSTEQTLRQALQYTSEAQFVLNSFGWSMLHILQSHSYTLYTGNHFKTPSL